MRYFNKVSRKYKKILFVIGLVMAVLSCAQFVVLLSQLGIDQMILPFLGFLCAVLALYMSYSNIHKKISATELAAITWTSASNELKILFYRSNAGEAIMEYEYERVNNLLNTIDSVAIRENIGGDEKLLDAAENESHQYLSTAAVN